MSLYSLRYKIPIAKYGHDLRFQYQPLAYESFVLKFRAKSDTEAVKKVDERKLRELRKNHMIHGKKQKAVPSHLYKTLKKWE